MTADDAKREAVRLGREHAGRSWVARETSTGDWAVVELKVPGGPRPTGPVTKKEGEPIEPPEGGDPRKDWDSTFRLPSGADATGF